MPCLFSLSGFKLSSVRKNYSALFYHYTVHFICYYTCSDIKNQTTHTVNHLYNLKKMDLLPTFSYDPLSHNWWLGVDYFPLSIRKTVCFCMISYAIVE